MTYIKKVHKLQTPSVTSKIITELTELNGLLSPLTSSFSCQGHAWETLHRCQSYSSETLSSGTSSDANKAPAQGQDII